VHLRLRLARTQHVVRAGATPGVLLDSYGRLSEYVGLARALGVAPAGHEARRAQRGHVVAVGRYAHGTYLAAELDGSVQFHEGDVKVPLGQLAHVVWMLRDLAKE